MNMAAPPPNPCYVFRKDKLFKKFLMTPTRLELSGLPEDSNLFWVKGYSFYSPFPSTPGWTRKDLTPILETCIPKTQRALAMLLIN